MTATTLYELAGVPETVPPDLVRAAALVEGSQPGPEAATALNVLADPDARKDYDARSSQGLAFELAMAWGIAAYSVGDMGDAKAHLERALHIAPDDRAIPLLLDALHTEAEPVVPSDAARAEARTELERMKNNTAFPHRLLRYTAAASEDEGANPAEQKMMARAARELLQYDIAEAPRSYAMILPVLKEHYPAVYVLDQAFFDATSAVLAEHAPSAQYERGKRRYRDSGPDTPARADAPPPLVIPDLRLPPMSYPDRRLDLSGLAVTRYNWIGAAVGALIFIEGGLPMMVRGALIGFALAWLLVWAFSRR